MGITGALRFGDGGDEGDEAGAAEELGDEEGGVALSFGGFDLVEARAEHAVVAAAFAEDSATIAAHSGVDEEVRPICNFFNLFRGLFVIIFL